MIDEKNEYYASKLASLIKCETVSVPGEENTEKFLRFHEVLADSFPRLFAVCEKTVVGASLLLRWKGSDPTAMPILLMSHMDVVDAAGEWTYPPFSGEIHDGRLWGRGTLDTKGSLFAMLQAAEELIEEGFVPVRDIYFESASTEETDGSGADAISKLLEQKKLRFYMTLDEGGMILHDPIGGADGDFAMIGVGEKGCADIKFIARSNGGHASMPGKNTPLVRLGRFVAAADRAKLFNVKMSPVVREMLRRMAPTMKGPMRFLCANVKLFHPLMAAVMPGLSNAAGALLKTTLAFTMCSGSEGTNVLPQEAWVIGNMRFSHHQGGENSIEAVRKLAAKFGVETQVLDPGFQSTVTDFNGEPFHLVERAVAGVFPGVRSVPYIMTGASDSRYFSRVSDSCLRFAPFPIDDAQLASMHGLDENVTVETLSGAVDFFRFIITEA